MSELDKRLEDLLLPPHPGEIGEGGEGPQIAYGTVENTKRYIVKLRNLLLEEKSVDIGKPLMISRDFSGGVDVLWKEEGEYSSLMNVSPNGSANYYWKTYDGSDEMGGEL